MRALLVLAGRQRGQGQHRTDRGEDALFGDWEGGAKAAVSVLRLQQPAEGRGVRQGVRRTGPAQPGQEGGVVGHRGHGPGPQRAEERGGLRLRRGRGRGRRRWVARLPNRVQVRV